jgi:hypothetical protein
MPNSITLANHYLYLSIFRIFLALHLFFKYLTAFIFQKEFYDGNSFSVRENNILLIENINFLFILILSFALLLIFGIWKNLTVVTLLILVYLFQGLNNYLLNGGDNFIKFVLFYMCFANSFIYFSLSKTAITPYNSIISKYAVLCIKIHLCIIYFSSAIGKITSKLWINGLATYYIFNIERFKLFNLPHWLILNSYFITFTTYINIVWELSFSYLAWFKKTKTLVIITALLFHLFVFNYMMLYEFQLLFIMVLGFFYTDRELIKIFIKFRNYGRLFRLGFSRKF